VVIPAFNEATSLGAVVGDLRRRGPNVVVVDDGSTDETSRVALETGAVLLRHRVNLGQGAALQTGITYALRQGALRIGTFDADGQHRADDLLALLDALEPSVAEVALGSRFLGAGAEVPAPRRLVLRAAVVFTRLMSGLAVTDAHNGLRAFTRRAASAIDLKTCRMAHASELLDQIARSGLPYRELPVRIAYTDYSLGKGQRSTAALRVLFDYLVSRVFD
jgi:glycosyltransferase involved in cell wall biosynthesis